MSSSATSSLCAVDPAVVTAKLQLPDFVMFVTLNLISLFGSGVLCAGFLKFKKLRAPPGDIIFGISVGDFILSLHWIVSSIFSGHIGGIADLSNNCAFCVTNAVFSVTAGFLEYFYNVCLCFYLMQSLRNALKAARMYKRTFHVVSITCSLGATLWLLTTNRLGKTLFGTCSLKYTQTSPSAYLGPVVVFLYAIISSYAFFFIKRYAPRCENSDKAVMDFLSYYNRYLIISVIIWSGIAITNMMATIIESDLADGTISRSLYITGITGNFFKMLTPLVLTIVRYNDKSLKVIMQRLVFFWRPSYHQVVPREEVAASLTQGLSYSMQRSDHVASLIEGDQEAVGGVHVQTIGGIQIAKDLRIQLTYTILSGILYTCKDVGSQNKHIDIKEAVRNSESYLTPKEYPISHQAVQSELPHLDFAGYSTFNGRFKFHGPHLFNHLLKKDADTINIQESLDFTANSKTIKKASSVDGGKGGEFFFFSSDNKLIIKTISKVELDKLIRILPSYVAHFEESPHSLIAKYYGVFTLSRENIYEQEHFVVMRNVSGMPSKYILRVYDMKGSTFDREKLKNVNLTGLNELNSKGTLKDMDFLKYEKRMYIKPELRHSFITQALVDATFFQSKNLMDYSLIVFVFNRRQYLADYGELPLSSKYNKFASLESTVDEDLSYNIGIIDYLQSYNINKMAEKYLKRVMKLNCSLDTSSQPATRYAVRFVDFVGKIVGEVE